MNYLSRYIRSWEYCVCDCSSFTYSFILGIEPYCLEKELDGTVVVAHAAFAQSENLILVKYLLLLIKTNCLYVMQQVLSIIIIIIINKSVLAQYGKDQVFFCVIF